MVRCRVCSKTTASSYRRQHFSSQSKCKPPKPTRRIRWRRPAASPEMSQHPPSLWHGRCAKNMPLLPPDTTRGTESTYCCPSSMASPPVLRLPPLRPQATYPVQGRIQPGARVRDTSQMKTSPPSPVPPPSAMKSRRICSPTDARGGRCLIVS
jgi:hypothetical protein